MLHEIKNATLVVSNSNIRVSLGEKIKGYFIVKRDGFGKFVSLFEHKGKSIMYWTHDDRREPMIFTSNHSARAMAIRVGGRVERATSQDVYGKVYGLEK